MVCKNVDVVVSGSLRNGRARRRAVIHRKTTAADVLRQIGLQGLVSDWVLSPCWSGMYWRAGQRLYHAIKDRSVLRATPCAVVSQSKRVVIIVSGASDGPSLREADIHPGTTVADVLREAKLQGYILTPEGSATYFAAEEELFPQVEDGSKLRATPITTLGQENRV
jgi:putative ubiquitin-RnfH superfamily antitoxin RatB of RatAB toxin-antitoxin module